MIRGVNTMFYSSDATALREFLRDKLDFKATDVGGSWLIFHLPEADMGVIRLMKNTVLPPVLMIFHFIATISIKRLMS